MNTRFECLEYNNYDEINLVIVLALMLHRVKGLLARQTVGHGVNNLSRMVTFPTVLLDSNGLGEGLRGGQVTFGLLPSNLFTAVVFESQEK